MTRIPRLIISAALTTGLTLGCAQTAPPAEPDAAATAAERASARAKARLPNPSVVRNERTNELGVVPEGCGELLADPALLVELSEAAREDTGRFLDGAQPDPTIIERAVLVVRQRDGLIAHGATRQQSKSDQRLKAVADADDQSASGHEGV